MPTDEPSPAAPTATDQIIVERDDGMYQLGWHDDAAGPFASRACAEAVAAKTKTHRGSVPDGPLRHRLGGGLQAGDAQQTCTTTTARSTRLMRARRHL